MYWDGRKILLQVLKKNDIFNQDNSSIHVQYFLKIIFFKKYKSDVMAIAQTNLSPLKFFEYNGSKCLLKQQTI